MEEQESLIYLDHHATTPVDPEVFKVVEKYTLQDFANPSSTLTAFGRKTDADIESARKKMAEYLGCFPDELYFTSGATESNNWVLRSLSHCLKKVVTSPIEHKCIINTCEYLKCMGLEVEYANIDEFGRVDADSFISLATKEPCISTLMVANNEVGTVNPIKEIAEALDKKELPFHTDAAQAIGRIPFHFHNLKLGFASFSAHKFYGPKGVGGLILSRKFRQKMKCFLNGGGQERGMRSGTLNVPGIMGMAKAMELVMENKEQQNTEIQAKSQWLWNELLKIEPRLKLNGHPIYRLPNNLNILLPEKSAGWLAEKLPHIAFSGTSACSSAGVSHVLKAMGRNEDEAHRTIRLGLGRGTTKVELEKFLEGFKLAWSEVQISMPQESRSLAESTT